MRDPEAEKILFLAGEREASESNFTTVWYMMKLAGPVIAAVLIAWAVLY